MQQFPFPNPSSSSPIAWSSRKASVLRFFDAEVEVEGVWEAGLGLEEE